MGPEAAGGGEVPWEAVSAGCQGGPCGPRAASSPRARAVVCPGGAQRPGCLPPSSVTSPGCAGTGSTHLPRPRPPRSLPALKPLSVLLRLVEPRTCVPASPVTDPEGGAETLPSPALGRSQHPAPAPHHRGVPAVGRGKEGIVHRVTEELCPAEAAQSAYLGPQRAHKCGESHSFEGTGLRGKGPLPAGHTR